MPRFPFPAALVIAALLLLAGCGDTERFAALPEGATVLAFGDSITHGTGADGAPAFPALLAARTGWNVINAGVPGDTAQAARDRIGPLLNQHNPALVIVELGGNDFLRQRNPDQVEADLEAIIAAIRERDLPVVLIAVPRLSLLRATVGALTDADLYAQLGERDRVLPVPDLLSEVLSDEALRADRIHPNGAGHEVLAEGLYTALANSGLAP